VVGLVWEEEVVDVIEFEWLRIGDVVDIALLGEIMFRFELTEGHPRIKVTVSRSRSRSPSSLVDESISSRPILQMPS
jgi:hypothetical protein